MFKKGLHWKREMETDILERSKEIKDLEEGEDKANAEKNLAERLKAWAEYKRANGEMIKGLAMLITGAAALGTFCVDLYKARTNKDIRNKIVDNEVNLVGNWEKTGFNDLK